MTYLSDVLSLLDWIIKEMFTVPIFGAFMGGFLMASVLGVALMIKGVAGGRR